MSDEAKKLEESWPGENFVRCRSIANPANQRGFLLRSIVRYNAHMDRDALESQWQLGFDHPSDARTKRWSGIR